MKKYLLLFLLFLSKLFTMAQSDGLIDYLDLIKNQEAVKRGDFKEITCLIELGKVTLLMDKAGRLISEIEDDADGFPITSEYLYEEDKLIKIYRRMGEKLLSTTYCKYDAAGNCIQERMVFNKIGGSNPTDKIIEYGNFVNGRPCYRKIIIDSNIQYGYEYDELGLLKSIEYIGGSKKQPVVKHQKNQIIIESFGWESDKISNIKTLTYNDKKQLVSYSINYLDEKSKVVFSYEYGSLGLLNNIKRNGKKIVTVIYK